MIDTHSHDSAGRTFAGHKQWVVALATALLLLLAAGGYAATDSSSSLSKANRLLFDTDHLGDLDVPAKLEYALTDSNRAQHADNKIRLAVKDGQREGKHVDIDFLAGDDEHRPTPDVDNAHGNPVIMLFLQNDVNDMAKRTGGNWRYFQHRIKQALAQNAQVSTTDARYGGHTVKAQRIVLTPFAKNSEHRKEIGKSLGKRYVFTLSDAVPGGVLEMRSDIPAPGKAKRKVLERLTLRSATGQKADSDSAATNG